MSKFWPCISTFSIIFLTAMAQASYAGDSDVLHDPDVKEAISLIRKEYIHEVDVETLERHCIEAVQEVSSARPPVDACLAGMVASLDPNSSYLDLDSFRAAIKEQQDIDPVSSAKLFNGEVGYIRISAFPEKIRDQIKSAVAGMVGESPPVKGLILDLRDNPGGVLIYPVHAAELFLSPPGVIAEVNGRAKGSKMKFTVPVYKGHPDKITGAALKTAPLVVLVNGKTARGAELLAAALRENGRAKIIGTATAKRGDVQTVVSLKSKKAMKLTSGYLMTPTGRRIDEDGVTIDTEVATNTVPVNLDQDATILQAYAELKSQLRHQAK